MSSLRLATASNVRAFQNLTTALSISDRKWTHAIDKEALEDEIGRFRVWAGNLGALQKGHSSLDYRLRDAPVSSTNTLKLLQELETNVNEAHAVVSGARLPYEEQTPPDLTQDDDNDDGFFSADSDDENSSNSSDEPRTELSMRFREIVDIIDNLYKLSVRIRTPGLRSRSLKASSYTQKDPETGVDIFDVYATQDLKHVEELVAFLRQPYAADCAQEEQDFLIKRLSAAVTLRRRHFKYWKRHRDKLSAAHLADEVQEVNVAAPLDGPAPVRGDGPDANPTIPVVTTLKEAPSQRTGKTLLSGTEATQLHQPLDDIIDNKSVTSYAVTVRDVHGKSIELPPPPKTTSTDKDFECPYCWVVCPARYSKGRPWRTHLLQDLQPYCCTYPDCESSHLLFRSRREWAEHEASHRKVWRCPEHPDAVFSTQSGLENHLRQRHLDSFPESQLETIAKVGEATAIDLRAKCPICCAPADTKELGDLPSHIANHLERIATFALPHGHEDDSDGASGIASQGSTSSKSLLGSVSAGMADEQVPEKDNQDSATLQPDQAEPVEIPGPGHDALSTENLQQLPDTSRNALDIILEQLNSPDSSYYQELAQTSNTPPPLEVKDIATLSSLYRSRRLLQTDQSYAPNDVYNRMISFCSHDLTKLKVDAIVNNAPLTLTHTPHMGTLHHAVLEAGGPLLLQEVRSRGRLDPGNVTWTRGYDLPSSFVIHAAAPTFIGEVGLIKFTLLGDCYRNALDTATELGLKTIAFPCLGTGGGIFPPRQAARTALQAVRDHLDAHPESRLERIIFCTMVAEDRQAYTDFFPVFFPPTHSDLDRARGSTLSSNHALLNAQILDTLVQVQKATTALASRLFEDVPEAQQDSTILQRINVTLESMHEHLHGSETLGTSQQDFGLLSSVLLDLCGHIIEMAQIAYERTGRTYQELRSETDQDMRAKQGSDLRGYLTYCWTFAVGLNQAWDSRKTELDMKETRIKLGIYLIGKKRQAVEGVRDNPSMLDRVAGGGPADERQVLSTPFFHESTAMSAYNQDSREQHHPSFSLSVRDLDPTVTEMSLFQLFKNKYPSTESAKIISLGGRSLGYGFVRFNSKEDQQKALSEMHGVYCGNRPMRIALTGRKDKVDLQDDETSAQDSTSPVSNRQGIVKLHQIPSVARFYQLGAIEAQSTLAPPSASFNDTVCLIKEDITRLEVDIIVNVTDKYFLGMGTLDRTIFRKGGPELQSELKKLGECKIGDVVTTPGYRLPAKYILHVNPPGVFRSDTKNILRNIYREILLKATHWNAKSIAIPCIGMGPPRDCASLAMEEVRRFLQSKEPGGLEKIIFTVYSSNNESIYRRLLPVYFPPPEGNPANRSEAQYFKRAETLPSKPTSEPEDSQTSHPEQASQTVSDERPLAAVIVRAFLSDHENTTPQPICGDLCVIEVFRSSFTISSLSDHLASPPSMSFSITPDTKMKSLLGFYDLVILEVQRDSAPPGDKAKVHIRCPEVKEVAVLAQALGRAIMQVAQDQKEKEKKTEGEVEQRESNVLPSSAKGKGKDTSIPAPEASRPDSIPNPESIQDTESLITLSDLSEDEEHPESRRRSLSISELHSDEEKEKEETHRVEGAGGESSAADVILPDSDTDSEDDENRHGSRDVPESPISKLRDLNLSEPKDSDEEKEREENRQRDQSPLAKGLRRARRGGHPSLLSEERRKANSSAATAAAERIPGIDSDSKDDQNRQNVRDNQEDVKGSFSAAEKGKSIPSAEAGYQKDVSALSLWEKFVLGELPDEEFPSPSAAADARKIGSHTYSSFSDTYASFFDPGYYPNYENSPHKISPQNPSDSEDSARERPPSSRETLVVPVQADQLISHRQRQSDAQQGVQPAQPSAPESHEEQAEEEEEDPLEIVEGNEPPEVLDKIAEDLHTRVNNWHGLDFSRFGKLRLHGHHIRIGKDRQFWQEAEGYLFSEMLICVQEKKATPPQWEGASLTKETKYTLKATILIAKHLNQVEHSPTDLILTLRLSIAELPAFHLQFRDPSQLELWRRALMDIRLDTKIIAHLTNDYLSRPTSYIGQHINDMAGALDTDTATLAAHLVSLEQKGKVHRTVDRETWVIDGWQGEMKPVVSPSMGGDVAG